MTRDLGAIALDSGSPAMRALVALVRTAYGDATLGDTAITAALELQVSDGLPETPVEVMRFLRSHLLGILTEEIGPRLTMAVVDDLLEQLTLWGAVTGTMPPVSAPRAIRVARVSARMTRASTPPGPGQERGECPSTLPPPSSLQIRVALVDHDRVGRTALARALVREGCEVIVLDTPDELQASAEAGEQVAAAIVDDRHPHATDILIALARLCPEAAIVARGDDLSRAREMVAACGFLEAKIRSRDASTSDLVDALRRSVK
jgi:hypothetical protein